MPPGLKSALSFVSYCHLELSTGLTSVLSSGVAVPLFCHLNCQVELWPLVVAIWVITWCCHLGYHLSCHLGCHLGCRLVFHLRCHLSSELLSLDVVNLVVICVVIWSFYHLLLSFGVSNVFTRRGFVTWFCHLGCQLELCPLAVVIWVVIWLSADLSWSC
jgi:hypothetical protein